MFQMYKVEKIAQYIILYLEYGFGYNMSYT